MLHNCMGFTCLRKSNAVLFLGTRYLIFQLIYELRANFSKFIYSIF